MRITDQFIRRPVLAIVVSVFILLLGAKAGFILPVRQFPQTVSATIQVSTTYYGADPTVVAGFITAPLERAISAVDGIDYMNSQSITGSSTITAYLRLNYDPYKALAELQTKVSSVSNALPPGSQVPQINIQTAGNQPTLIIGFNSRVMSPEQITDYLKRIVVPNMQSVDGVQGVDVWGAQPIALRAWLDPAKMAARGLNAADVSAAMAANNFVTGAGATSGQMMQTILGVNTDLHTERDFRDLVIRHTGDTITRLGDIADVKMGADDYSVSVIDDGTPGIFVAVDIVPTANVLEVINRANKRFKSIQEALPTGLNGHIEYDATVSVRESIYEVAKTLLESLVIVTLVVFAFLRSARASLIPVITIPLSLIGTFGMLYIFGFSINLLTLLALVLSTGLVVDDAIIVVENVAREIADGRSALEASLRSARQLTSPIIAMTVVLIAVYVPVALRSGLTGALFSEFALTLVGSVTVSAVLALALSPMMCRFLLKNEKAVVHKAPLYERLYVPLLHRSLSVWPLMLAAGGAILVATIFFYQGAAQELAPQEDEGFMVVQGSAPSTATVDYLNLYSNQLTGIYNNLPEKLVTWQWNQPGSVQGGVVLKPWSQRHRNTNAVQADLQQQLFGVAGLNMALFQPPSLPGSFGLPVEYVLKTTKSFADLDTISDEFKTEAIKSGMFAFVDRDLKIDQPQATVVIDRNKVAAIGLDMARVGSVLNTMLSGGYINYFSIDGHSYKVIPQVARKNRLNPDQVLSYTIADQNGVPVPLSAVAHIETHVVPEQISHFQQMNSATISAVPLPGVTQDAAKNAMDAIAGRILPPGYSTDASGPLRQYVQESSGFLSTFGLAMVVIYLSLSALFSSFRDPLIILVSVPMSMAGALVFIYFGVGGATLNIYTQVGLVTLMGLISKHGILMVEVANEQQALGRTKRAAIEHAAQLRLRPILMTTAAMVLGVLPLVFASGAGAAARFAMGLVIASGLAIGTLFTLFVLPSFYLLLARHHDHDEVMLERTAAMQAAD